MSRGAPERPKPTPLASGLLLTAGLWMISHPYEGIRHDATLYAGQALLHLAPEVFRGDLFFAWGSQDRFTVFGRLYAFVVAMAGLANASAILYLFASLAWLWVAVRWARAVLQTGAWVVAAACVVALRHGYSVDMLFEVGETFVTARLFAEPLTLAALLAAALGRPVACAVMIVSALLIHPLMALPGLGAIVVLALQARFGFRNVVLAGVAAAGIAFATASAVSALPRYDDAWFGLVRARNSIAVPSEWSAVELARWGSQLLLLVAASRMPGVALPGVWRAVALVGLAGVVLSFGGDLTRVTYLIQAQPWRAMWLTTWLAPLALVAIFAALPRQALGHRLLVLAGIPALALLQHTWLEPFPLITLVYSFGLVAAVGERSSNERPLARAASWAWLLGLTSLSLGCSALASYLFHRELAGLTVLDRLFRTQYIVEFAWFVSPLVAALCMWLRTQGGRLPAAATALSLCVLGAGAWYADSRTPSTRDRERLTATGIEKWQAAIPRDASVFWPEHLRHVWFVLQRSSYVSRYQQSGTLFNRPTAFEAFRRTAHIAAIGGADGVFDTRGGRTDRFDHAPTREDLADACSDPALDFVVLPPSLAEPIAPDFVDPVAGRTYRLYDCRPLR